MADFYKCIPVIFRHEGGLADNPHDPGGITNYGISIRFCNARNLAPKYFGHDGDTTRQDIRNLNQDLAQTIYKDIIWDPNKYYNLDDDLVGTKVFDTSVNMGEKWGEILCQQAANRLGQNLAVDGNLGPVSFAAINALDPKLLLKQYCQLQAERYQHIVHDRPESAVFLKNWLARAAWPFNG